MNQQGGRASAGPSTEKEHVWACHEGTARTHARSALLVEASGRGPGEVSQGKAARRRGLATARRQVGGPQPSVLTETKEGDLSSSLGCRPQTTGDTRGLRPGGQCHSHS